MGKNIAKSLFWYGLYTISQMLITIIIICIDIFRGKFDFFSSGDSQQIADGLIEYINRVTLPTLIFTAIIVSVVYLIFVLTKKEKVDLAHIEFDKFSFMAITGISYNFVLTAIIGIFTFILTMLFSEVKEIIDTANSSNAIINTHPFLISLLGTGILVPIMEEIVFRYGICGILSRNNRTAGIIVSSVVFGLAHGNPIQVIYTMLLGFVLAIVYVKYDNIWYPIITHMTFNSLSVVAGTIGSDMITYILGPICILGMIIMICCNKEIRTILKLPKIEKPIQQPVFIQGQYPQYPQYPVQNYNFTQPMQQNIVYQNSDLYNICNKYAVQQPVQQPVQYTEKQINNSQNNFNRGDSNV